MEVTGLTAARMLEIEDASVVSGEVVGDDLILTTFGGDDINAGVVRGADGAAGPPGPTALAAADVISWNADTNLYRGALDVLKTDDSLHVVADLRIALNNTGKMYFGSAFDTNLYRSAADTLKTDDHFIIGNYLTIGTADLYQTTTRLVTDSIAGGSFSTKRMLMGAVGPAGEGGLLFSSSAADGDTNLYRYAANTLVTDDDFGTFSDLTARSTAAAQLYIGSRGPASQAGIQFGSALDTNLYRSAADTLKTDDNFIIGINGGKTTLSLSDTTANVGLTIGADTNLYRQSANALKTDDAFAAAGSVIANDSAANMFQLWTDGKLYFGSAADTNLYRSAADTLKTDDAFVVGGALTMKADTWQISSDARQRLHFATNAVSYYKATQHVFRVNNVDTDILTLDASGTLIFGSAGDTNLYRSAADILKTDDQFQSASDIKARIAAASQVMIGSQAGDAALIFGSALDTNLYRFAANNLKTDDTFDSTSHIRSELELQARFGQAALVKSGQVGPSNEAGIIFGSAQDTNLYRNGANNLRTDDMLDILNNNGLRILSSSGTTIGFTMANTSGQIAFDILANGKQEWSDGAGGAVDVALYRASANQLNITASGIVLNHAAPILYFGSAADTNIYRSAANTLKTDDALIVTGDLTPQGRYTSFTHANAELLFGAAGDVSLGRPGVANVLRLGDGDSLQLGYTPSTGNFIEFFEQTADPAAATANAARLFAKDNGAGKTQLVVRFQSGATQVLATEP